VTDAEQIKNSVDIVAVIGQFVDLKQTGSGYMGCCPFHDEKTPSFNVHPDGFYKCHGGCEAQGDVIDFIQKYKNLDFKGAVKFLGGEIKTEKPASKKQKKKKAATPVPLDYEAAKNHYTLDIMQDRANYLFKDNPHEFKQAWPYKNDDGQVELVAARFEDKDGNKTVLSMYWNGKTIKLAGYPVLLLNRDLLKKHPEKPVLIVEGEKTAAAAAALTDFVATTWNGGHAKSDQVDWSPLKNREVFILPDDDQQTYKNGPRKGQLMPAHEQPGNKAAAKVKKKLPHAKIIKPVIKARKVKKSGADVVEILQVMSDDELTAHILATKSDNKSEVTEDLMPAVERPAPTSSDYPFHILGLSDDGQAYFISTEDRLYPMNPMSFTKTKLYNLMPLQTWETMYSEDHGTGGKMWENAISDLIQAVNHSDFDPDRMRGRGAWREPDGRICYHDGENTVGKYDKKRVFLKKSPKKIGIGKKHATPDERMGIYVAASRLTFATISDCIRTLSWSVLAPFAGALPWRSAALLTGGSGSGKTTIVNEIIKKLSMSKVCSGGDTTAAGVRQEVGVDSCSVVVEEAEGDTPKKKQNRDDIFSLMRQSTSDDSPDVWKGTIDGKGVKFKLSSMFLFVAIDPTINCEADEKRIFRVPLINAPYQIDEWLEREAQLIKSITPEICDGIRSYTWDNLDKILCLAKRITPEIQRRTKMDNRTAYADAILLAAHLAVFKDQLSPSEDSLNEYLNDFYSQQPIHHVRSENEEMVENLLDHIIREGSVNYTVRELLYAIKNSRITDEENPEDDILLPPHEARRIVGHFGFGVTPDNDIAIAKNHPEIMKILDKGKGYQLQLMRHPRLVERNKVVSLGSKNSRNCVVIGWEEE
jgi:hypothetical protein